MTSLENVMTATDTHKKSGLLSGLFGMPISRREEKRDKARAQELLDFIGIGEYSDRLAKNLPYGVQRRLEIARALGTEPKLLLLDEPAAVLTLQRRLSSQIPFVVFEMPDIPCFLLSMTCR